MERTDIHANILDLLVDLAPEFTADEIVPNEDLREQLDIDSMDLHQLSGRVYEVFGVDIPEEDRAGLTTVDSIVAYVVAHRA